MAGNASILFDQYGAPMAGYSNAPMASQQPAALVAGSDYGAQPRAQLPKVDATGQQYMVPVAPNGVPVPVQIGASAANPFNMFGQVSLAWSPTSNAFVPFQVDPTGAGVVRQALAATYEVNAVVGTGTAANRSMISIINTGTMVHRILAVYATCPPQVNTTGGLLGIGSGTSYIQVIMGLYRITGHSGGTQVTPMSHDPSDTIDAGITARTGATVAGDTQPALLAWDAAYNASFNAAARQDQNTKVVTIPPGAGVHVRMPNTLSANVNFIMRMVLSQNTA